MSAEFRGAGVRRRQLISMAGTGTVQVLALMLLFFILTRTVGIRFFISALAGNYTSVGNGAIGSAGYVYFSALVAKNAFVVVLLAILFLGWFLPAVYINVAMPHRAILTWAFDGLLPRGLSDTNERTHTPVRAIALTFLLTVPMIAWICYGSNAFQYIALNALFGFVAIGLVGVSATLIKWRRRDLYEGTPARFVVFGVEVLPLAGVMCTAAAVFATFLALYFHTQLGLNLWGVIAAAGGMFVVGGLWWLLASGVRRSQGIDLKLAYTAIPPE
jgi:amino acid transporter